MIPDLMLDATTSPNVGTIYDQVRTLGDFKIMTPSKTYKETVFNKKGNYAVEKRAREVDITYDRKLRAIDTELNRELLIDEGQIGPMVREKKGYGKEGKVVGLVIGPFGECSEELDQLIQFIARQATKKIIDGLNIKPDSVISIMTAKLRSEFGMLIHREWARLLIARASELLYNNRIEMTKNVSEYVNDARMLHRMHQMTEREI